MPVPLKKSKINQMGSPPSHGVSSGLQDKHQEHAQLAQTPTKRRAASLDPKPVNRKSQKKRRLVYPNMTAFQSMMLLSCGAPLMPAGGSCCSRLKSRISRFLAGVDISASQTLGSGGQAPIPRRAPGTAAPAGSPPGARRERRSFAASEREGKWAGGEGAGAKRSRRGGRAA